MGVQKVMVGKGAKRAGAPHGHQFAVEHVCAAGFVLGGALCHAGQYGTGWDKGNRAAMQDPIGRMIAFGRDDLSPRLARAGRFALDLVLPPQCLSCQMPVAEPGHLCGKCWSEIDFIDGPCCTQCGLPFETPELDGALCGSCSRSTPAYEKARAVMRYNDASKGLILRLKHADRHEGVGAYGRWLARAGAGYLSDVDVIGAVPLYRLRLISRLYNQAALLALALGAETGIPADPMILERVRRTPSQGGLTRRQRRHNVAGAFRVRPGYADRIEGRKVLLVDDVMTTGATVEACARTLTRAGASGVHVLTLARVVRPN